MTGNTTYIQNYGQLSGQVKYNTATQNLEVYDGVNWSPINQAYATIDLTDETKNILEWAMKKMQDEAILTSLAAKHPAIKASFDHYKNAEKNLLVTTILSIDNNNS